MMKPKSSSFGDRLQNGGEVRELKLGCTFNSKNTTTAFHTIKYDFKPASVDKSRIATVDVGSNNQVTVTVPNLVSSGVPHTVYKGNHRKYIKECLIIFDRRTGDVTLERLNNNIQVKKTRNETTNKANTAIVLQQQQQQFQHPPVASTSNSGAPLIAGCLTGASSGSLPKLENSTMRVTSKTKVSTGSRRNNIIDFKPRNSPNLQQSGSPSTIGSVTNKSPQSAPAWNANNTQATLPSIPMIVDDDEDGGIFAINNNMGGGSSSGGFSYGNNQEFQAKKTSKNSKQSKLQSSNMNDETSSNAPQRNVQEYGMHHQQQQQAFKPRSGQQSFPLHEQKEQHALPQNQHMNLNTRNVYQRGVAVDGQQSYTGSTSTLHNVYGQISPPMHQHESNVSLPNSHASLDQQIGVLSSSSSSSESDSSASESGSDSDDSTENDPRSTSGGAETASTHQQQNHLMHQLPCLGNAPISPVMRYQQQQQQQQHHAHFQQSNNVSNGVSFPNELLQNDLQLSSNSSDDDDT